MEQQQYGTEIVPLSQTELVRVLTRVCPPYMQKESMGIIGDLYCSGLWMLVALGAMLAEG